MRHLKAFFCWAMKRSGILLLLLSTTTLNGQVVINELCASNSNTILDEYGESSDWIELYNAGEEAVYLGNYFISDDPAEADKWLLPEINLEPEAFLLIFASDRDEYGVFPHANFKLSAGGESVLLSNEAGEVLDQILFPELETDQSMGRQADGNLQWALFSEPTPNTTNNGAAGSGFTAAPEWASTGSFYSNSQAINLTHPNSAARIYFTRDGSVPDQDDELYTDGITVDTTTALRAVAIADGMLPSAVVSRTIFIDDYHSIPVISIMGEPDDFWSWERGILIDGGPNAQEEWPYYGANYWSDEEYPIHTEFFTEDGTLGIALNADTRIHGGRGARTNPMKPLRLLVKKKYGSSTIEYPFFEERERTTYKRLVLRNASGDYNYGHIRDAFLARYFLKSGLNLDVLAHRPVMVYINGAFYGLFNLREKSDAYYLKHNYDLDIDDLDLLEEDSTVVEGDFTVFDTMFQYVLDHDLEQQEYFDQANTYFDTENIAECFAVQSIVNNGDWLHNNIKYWRERKEGARWRYLLFDLDAALGRFGWTQADEENLDDLITPLVAIGNKHSTLFRRLLDNEGYRHYFINRYADLLNTMFRSEIFREEVDRTVAEIDPEMPRHFERWTWPGYDTWRNERLSIIYDFVEDRPAYARQHVRDYFSLANEVKLELQTFPQGAGSVRVNTIETAELPWDGIYFNGVPVELEIIPNPGFTFSHWTSAETIKDPDSAPVIRYNFTQDDQVVAHFSGVPDKMLLEVYIDNNEQFRINLQLPEADRVELSLYNMAGQLIQTVADDNLLAGLQTYMVSAVNLPAGMYLLSAQRGNEVVTARVVHL